MQPIDVNGVFFDLYGTLLIYGDMEVAWRDWLEALYTVLARCGLEHSRDWLAGRCDGFFTRPEPPVQQDGLTVYERRIRVFTTELGLDLDAGQLRAAADTSVAAWQRSVTLDPQAIPVLESVRSSRPVALVSNFDHPPHLHRLLDRHGLTGLFVAVVISSEEGIKKPDPGIFSRALAATGLDANEVAYVGDSDEDVQAATAGGLVAIRINRSGTPTADMKADYTAEPTTPRPAAPSPRVDGCRIICELQELPALLSQRRSY